MENIKNIQCTFCSHTFQIMGKELVSKLRKGLLTSEETSPTTFSKTQISQIEYPKQTVSDIGKTWVNVR